MIGSVALARRIEAAETRLSLAMAASSRRAGIADAFGLPIAGGAAVYCGPGAPMTKVIGLAMEAPLTDGDIDAIERAYDSTGERPGIEMATLADLGTVRRLEARGYRLQRIELVLGAELHGLMSDPQPEAIEVTHGPEADWARIAVEGFAAAETVEGRETPAESYDRSALERVVGQFAGVSDVRRYVAHIDGVAAGSASARDRRGPLSTVRGRDPAGLSSPRHPDGTADRAAGGGQSRGLRCRRRIRRARIPIAGQRAPPRLRPALQPPGPGT